MPARPRTTQNTPFKETDETHGECFSLDIGKTQGLYNSVGFRDKVLQWQQSADAAADAANSDCASEVALGNGSPQATTRRTKGTTEQSGRKYLDDDSYLASKIVKDNEPPMKRPGIYKMDREMRRASAPKKRVVSDEHWKITREGDRIRTEPETGISGLKNNEGLKGYKAEAWVRKKPGLLKRELQEAAVTAAGKVKELDDPVLTTKYGLPTYRRPRQRSAVTKLLKRDFEGATNRVKSKERTVKAVDMDYGDSRDWPAETGEAVARKRKVDRTKSHRTGDDSNREEQQSVLSHDSMDDAPLDYPDEPAAPPQIHSNSIEAWLTNTPDPFIDHKHHGNDTESRNHHRRDRESRKKDTIEGEAASHADCNATLKRHGATRSSDSPRNWPTKPQVLSASLTNSSISGVSNDHYLLRGANRGYDLENDPVGRDTTRSSDDASTFDANSASQQHSAEGGIDESQDKGKMQSGFGLAEPSGPSDRQAAALIEHGTRITTDDDLISILSRAKPNRSAQSIRSKHSMKRSQFRTTAEIMSRLEANEKRYFLELRTLVDGVIPVLLSCVLSKSNSSVAHDLFGVSDEQTATSTIVNMGIALERLNSAHRRVPTQKPEALLVWAQSANRIYADYLKVWKMGFQDVVVNLVPGEDAQGATSGSASNPNIERSNMADQVVRSEGEKVDVAYLLKRPLVRIKQLAATLKDIHNLSPSEQSERWSTRFEDLVSQARTKQNEERARLEDEAAASIDATRARDPATLAALLGAKIDSAMSVQARDFFDLELCHSSGQRLNCHVELILRDSHDGSGSGDVLICEVDDTTKWLLFPSVMRSNLSARKGSGSGEIVILMRGSHRDGQEWSEVLSLTSHDPMAVSEWVEMLGSYPMPPAVTSQAARFSPIDASLMLASGYGFGHLSPSEIDVPVGEQPTELSRQLGSTVSFVQEAWSGEQRILSNRQDSYSALVRPPDTFTCSTQHSTGLREDPARTTKRTSARPALHRYTSEIPSQSLPIIPKARRGFEADSPAKVHDLSQPGSPIPSQQHQQSIRRKPVPQPSPSSGLTSTPQLAPVVQTRRRSSSPLKHEYQPSSDSVSDDEADGYDPNDAESITSNSSAGDVVPSIPPAHIFKKANLPRAPPTLYSADGAATLSPSNSASQAPYRHAPQQSGPGPKTIASIFSWSEQGLWEHLHPDECSIVVSPGLIQAFEMTANHSKMSDARDRQGESQSIEARPLVALELTPLVPLRRGTAIDISIRSPPTAASLLQAGNNVMFRSRNGQECEMLYNLINHARINNPTYIALQNARATSSNDVWGSYASQPGSRKSSSGSVSSWWRFGSKRAGGYRAGNTRRAQSTSGGTESSIATMTSAFSALHRFSENGNRLFNVAKSTITSRAGGMGMGRNLTQSSNTFSSSGSQKSGEPECPTSGSQTPVPADLLEEGSTPLGLINQKIRLYMREAAGRWRDMGSARLTIMHPPRSASMGPITPAKLLNQERRIVVIGKTQGERLLDATLGETSFERVARTGIAVSVWERLIGPNGEEGTVGKTGGVVGTRVKVYMVQLKSEAETAYTFSLVGKLRY